MRANQRILPAYFLLPPLGVCLPPPPPGVCLPPPPPSLLRCFLPDPPFPRSSFSSFSSLSSLTGAFRFGSEMVPFGVDPAAACLDSTDSHAASFGTSYSPCAFCSRTLFAARFASMPPAVRTSSSESPSGADATLRWAGRSRATAASRICLKCFTNRTIVLLKLARSWRPSSLSSTSRASMVRCCSPIPSSTAAWVKERATGRRSRKKSRASAGTRSTTRWWSAMLSAYDSRRRIS
mmetsp:Transcript_51121/g.121141  ORF Transcript_51121/g.121141 Transcript_51121/m.121141 type:complete len:236 (-) Transcript_51121:497-1204(-)